MSNQEVTQTTGTGSDPIKLGNGEHWNSQKEVKNFEILREVLVREHLKKRKISACNFYL